MGDLKTVMATWAQRGLWHPPRQDQVGGQGGERTWDAGAARAVGPGVYRSRPPAPPCDNTHAE